MSDIVASKLPFWDKTRVWILARPMTGFSETFSQYIVEVSPGGGSDKPEPDRTAEAALFVTHGEIALSLHGKRYSMAEGGFAYVPPGAKWSLHNETPSTATFHWIRKRYSGVDGIDVPHAFVTNENAIKPDPMPDTDGRWSTTRFVDANDIRHDMNVTIVNLASGAVIPFAETHVMEHGLYVLQGKGVYLLNQDWVEVEAGDFMWLRAFCPQACYAGGPEAFRYLLYKDVNRHPNLVPHPQPSY